MEFRLAMQESTNREIFNVRLATLADIPVLQKLIAASVRKLQAQHYSPVQMDAAIGSVFGVDTQLIHDGTYFAVEAEVEGVGRAPEGRIVACGGWSRRKTLFGSDNVPGKDDRSLDPSHDAARIRAVFVDPDWARRGIASRIMRACEDAASAAGFTKLSLVATLTGENFFKTKGFSPTERYSIPLPDGQTLPVVAMDRPLNRYQSRSISNW
jgi:N-acetylglutamate synthase-like GNAT family acetyltransferase